MSQLRFFNFKDDDSTASLIRWFTGILSPGLYHGYDFNPTANMNLNLNHNTTGFKDVDSLEAESGFQSLIITRQGSVIKENAAITINGVANGHATLARIDTVVLTHQYVATAGGTQALYSIITGTPSGSPVAPALSNTAIQIKIGELYIPANTVALNGVGVIWTRSVINEIGTLNVIGNRVYSPGNFITTGQTITASLGALDVALKSEQLARIAADSSEASTRASADSAEAATRASADSTEATLRSIADSSEASTRASADSALNAAKVDRAGDTITGALVVNGDLSIGNRLLLTGTALLPFGFRTSMFGDDFQIKKIPIGNWNMNSGAGGVASIPVPHGLTSAQWVNAVCEIMIIDDGAALVSNLLHRVSAGDFSSGDYDIDSTNVNLRRRSGGWYDSSPYDSSPYNRGFIYIKYTG